MRLLLILLSLLLAPVLLAEESILSYHSDIRIEPDGGLAVTETLTVRAEGDRIRRGIYRDFPTTYRDRAGNRIRVEFEPLEVLRDGRPEPWFTERRNNGVRLNTGDDSFLTVPADIVYTLRYRTTRQLGFFAEHDELYWNVTGNGWIFPIWQASADVRLPEPVAPAALSAEAYTGVSGSRGQDYRMEIIGDGARYFTTRALARQEGLTIVLGFPKGIVPEPTTGQRVAWVLQDNRGVLVALLGLAVLLVFYVTRWQRVGRDPVPGPIFPQYDPPPGESPAGLRYLNRMAYDNRCFTADLIDMAVRGHIRIERDKGLLGDTWVLIRIPGVDVATLSAGQQALATRLFDKADRCVLEPVNARIINAARSAQAMALARLYQPRHFASNIGTIGLGVLISVVFGIAAVLLSGGSGLLLMVGILVVMILVHVVFGFLMRAPTAEGRRLLDRIAGLKLYLGVAERDELGSLSGPGNAEARPALDLPRYEALLPYAVALDVEEAWTGRFTLAVGAAAAAVAAQGITWYRGSGRIDDIGHISRDLGSTLNSQISSAATPPGSSSGGGGGGFSGGGGGGGGGGGR